MGGTGTPPTSPSYTDRPMITAGPDLRGDPARHRRERRVKLLMAAAGVFTIAVSVAIVLSLLTEAISFLGQIDLGQLWAKGWFPRRGRFDLRTIVVHTLLVTAVAMVVAVPLGMGAAIYLSEYAPRHVRRVLKPVVEVLAGIPSVVLGFFALTWITPNVMRRIWEDTQLFNMGAAGIAVGIMIVPLIASVAEDAMRAVPDALRQASYGLGARKKHTTLRVVVPAALSGITAGFILAASRAIGETMIVAIAAGASGGSLLTFKITEGGQTMTGAMASLAIGSDQVAGVGAAFQSLFFVGLLLFVFTLLLNIASERVIRRFRERY